jgi:hypothetical protein
MNKLFLVTAFVPTSDSDGKFRTLGLVAKDATEASSTAALVFAREIRDVELVELMEILTATAVPHSAVVYDSSGNAYRYNTALLPVEQPHMSVAA